MFKEKQSSLLHLCLLPHTYTQDKLFFPPQAASSGHSVTLEIFHLFGTSSFLPLGRDRCNPATGKTQQVINYAMYNSTLPSFHNLFGLVIVVHSLPSASTREQNTHCILKEAFGDEKWAAMRNNTLCADCPVLLCLVCCLSVEQRGALDNRWKISPCIEQGLQWRLWPTAFTHRKDAFAIQKILQSNLSQETEGR